MSLDGVPHEGEAESAAADRPDFRAGGPVKFLENPAVLRRVDAYAAVGNGYGSLVIVRVQHDLHAALPRRVFYRIVDDVFQRLY